MNGGEDVISHRCGEYEYYDGSVQRGEAVGYIPHDNEAAEDV